MRSFAVIVAALPVLAACSSYVEVRVFNATPHMLRACSLGEGQDCIDLAPGLLSGVMSWKRGAFSTRAGDCTRTYAVPGIGAADEYRPDTRGPLQVVIAPDHALLLVRRHVQPEAASPASQPPGFPVRPAASGPACP